MNTGSFELLTFGVLMMISGALLLIAMVRELTPGMRRKWVLGVALGTGIIAFGLKIGLVVLFSLFPSPMLALFPAGEYQPVTLPAPLSIPGDKQAYTWRALPAAAPYPSDNPPTPEKIALGRTLFFDTRLSADGTLSCASCHVLDGHKAGADGRSTSVGIQGQVGDRNAPTVINAAYQRHLFWDGRAASLEEQALGPLLNPVEMGMPDIESVLHRVRTDPAYEEAFAQAFPDRPALTAENLARAIAAYERTLITPDTPYDRFVRGERQALSAKQQRGMALFESTGCVQCHSGPNFSGASLLESQPPFRIFPAVPGSEFEKRYRLTLDKGLAGTGASSGLWRIPSLRNVARTAPYFHNGSVNSLEEAVRIMAHLQLDKPLSNNPQDDIVPLRTSDGNGLILQPGQALSDREVNEIVSFLEALSGDPSESRLPPRPKG